MWWQATPWDGTNLYVVSSDAGITGKAYAWLTVPALTVVNFVKVALAPGSPGNFAVAHGLGKSPTLVMVRMKSGGAIWLQSPGYDATNLNLVASDGGITGEAECWTG